MTVPNIKAWFFFQINKHLQAIFSIYRSVKLTAYIRLRNNYFFMRKRLLFHAKNAWSFLLVENNVHCGIKVNLKTLALERTMWGAFNFNGCNKLVKNSFNNILAMKISVVFEFNGTNSSSAGTNLDTFRFYQKFQLKYS